MTTAPLRVLCLDIEGGYGGSSRSLEAVLGRIDRARVEPEIWCKREGPVQARYRDLEIPTRVTPEMPSVSSLPKLSRNLLVYGRFLTNDWRRARRFRNDLVDTLEQRFDLLHCNHESLFLLARWLRPRIRIPLTVHIRTNLWQSPFARWQTRILAEAADRLVFITENERDNFQRLLGREPDGRVIYNAVAPLGENPAPIEKFAGDPRFKIACLSNYSWLRGVDRLVDLAAALAKAGCRDVLFLVAGDMRLPRSLPGMLGRIARANGSLADYAHARSVADMFEFLGHVKHPECVLATSDALIKPTREANPWGRDIIEALAMAKPVITFGTWDGFVSHGETGILHHAFNAGKLASEIAALAGDRPRARAMGGNGQIRIAAKCDPSERAADLTDLWCDVMAARAP